VIPTISISFSDDARSRNKLRIESTLEPMSTSSKIFRLEETEKELPSPSLIEEEDESIVNLINRKENNKTNAG
jgi:hypothetical protein